MQSDYGDVSQSDEKLCCGRLNKLRHDTCLLVVENDVLGDTQVTLSWEDSYDPYGPFKTLNSTSV